MYSNVKYFHVHEFFFALHIVFMFTADGPNFTDPGNVSLDSKIDLLDKIYHEGKLFSY